MRGLYRNKSTGSVVIPDMHVMSELDVMSSWRRPAGSLDRKVCAFVFVACAVTLAVALVGPRWFWSAYGDHRINTFWIHNGLGLLVGAILVAALSIRGTSPALRLAIALPLAHIAAITAAWSAWMQLSPHLPDARYAGPILGMLPMGATTIGALLLCGAVGWMACRREWLHGMLVMALSSLLAVGLWLPIASAFYFEGMRRVPWDELARTYAHGMVAFVLVPPLCIAAAYTVYPWLRRLVSATVPLAFLVALIARVAASEHALAMYGNFVHVLLALTIAAISSIAVLGLALLFRARRAARLLRDAHTGTIECDGTAIHLELPSWLRGPRLVSRAFAVRTGHHVLVIPAGVDVASPIPPITTQLRGDEALDLARAGDTVVLGGFVDPDPDHPFRSISAPQPGPDGIVVAREGKTTFGDRDVALALWRPCVAYLVIAVAVALPGLVAALAMK
jgi:hypothetical protein